MLMVPVSSVATMIQFVIFKLIIMLTILHMVNKTQIQSLI